MADKNKTDSRVNKELTAQDLNKKFWDSQYETKNTGWDLGEVSPPLKNYIDQLTDKNCRILIPGCGNTYEAVYLLKKGFTNITLIDISPILVKKLQNKFKENPSINVIEGDFFEHHGEYDLILEQTFFCALHPTQRANYIKKMYSLLAPNGKLSGVLFNRHFDFHGPPFGGIHSEYIAYFKDFFLFKVFETCTNSFSKRAGNELFMVLVKK